MSDIDPAYDEDGDGTGAAESEVVTPEVVSPDVAGPARRDDGAEDDEQTEAVTQPAKVMRIGSMVKQLLEEVRTTELDEASRERLAEVYERSVVELSEALSPDLQEELRSLALPFDHDDVPSGAELRVAKAQLVGWLEGLFHGIQASLMAQQMAARAQLQQMRELPAMPGQMPGQMPGGDGAGTPRGDDGERPGTYL